MTRILGAVLCVSLCGLIVSGQQKVPASRFERLTEGEVGIRLTAESTEIQLEDLVMAWSSLQKRVLLFEPKKITGRVTVAAPVGSEFRGEKFDSFVADCLFEYRLCLIDCDAIVTIAPVIEAQTYGAYATESDLDRLNPAFHYCCLIPLKAAHPGRVMAMIRSIHGRTSGHYTEWRGHIMVADRPRVLKKFAALIRELDSTDAIQESIKAYNLPTGVEQQVAVAAVQNLFREPNVVVTVTGGKPGTIIVRGPAGTHVQIPAALEALK